MGPQLETSGLRTFNFSTTQAKHCNLNGIQEPSGFLSIIGGYLSEWGSCGGGHWYLGLAHGAAGCYGSPASEMSSLCQAEVLTPS